MNLDCIGCKHFLGSIWDFCAVGLEDDCGDGNHEAFEPVTDYEIEAFEDCNNQLDSDPL